MSRTRKNHPASFKAKVVLSALQDDEPVSELALKYAVHATVIHRWKKEALSSMEAGFSEKLEKVSADKSDQIHELLIIVVSFYFTVRISTLTTYPIFWEHLLKLK